MTNEPEVSAASHTPPVLFAPSITQLPESVEGRVVLTGSHGGLYTGHLAAARQLGGVVFHDAGGGLDGAGTGALALLSELGLPAAAVGHQSARIGDPDDMLRRGVISAANEPAALRGVCVGGSVGDALAVLRRSPATPSARLALPTESRFVVATGSGPALVLVDSASLVDPQADQRAVVVTGSHGGLVGGDPSRAIRADCSVAVFNDAGIGADDAGIGRLSALARRGIVGITVSHTSARIGDALSTLAGSVSACNSLAAGRGVRPGDRLAAHVLSWCAANERALPR